MWTIRHQTPENIEVVLAMHTAQFNKRNVLCEMTATCVTVGMVRTLSSSLLFIGILTASMQKDAPSANGSPNTIILQGQWESAIVKDESTWTLDDGKLVLDIRKRVEGEWKVRTLLCRHPPAFLFVADSHS
jgi:23S rRNA C2498 (ribose-2'-O)-methylase RlmM